jgi:hypothetical protein
LLANVACGAGGGEVLAKGAGRQAKTGIAVSGNFGRNSNSKMNARRKPTVIGSRSPEFGGSAGVGACEKREAGGYFKQRIAKRQGK